MTLAVEDISETYADMIKQAFKGFRQGNPAYLFFVTEPEVTKFVVDNMRALTSTLQEAHLAQVEHRNTNDQMVMWYCLWFAMSSFTDAIRSQIVGGNQTSEEDEELTIGFLYEDETDPTD